MYRSEVFPGPQLVCELSVASSPAAWLADHLDTLAMDIVLHLRRNHNTSRTSQSLCLAHLEQSALILEGPDSCTDHLDHTGYIPYVEGCG